MSEVSPGLVHKIEQIDTALAEVEAQISAIRQRVRGELYQGALLLQIEAAWAGMSKRERALFCEKNGLIKKPASLP